MCPGKHFRKQGFFSKKNILLTLISEIFLSKSGNRTKILFFLGKKSFFWKCSSGNMECSFGNSAIFVLRETRKILAQSQKVRETFFLPEISPSKCSTGHVECLPDEHGVFLANQIFLRKTMKRSKVVSSSEERFFKMFLWWRGFCCWHPSWELLPKIRNFFIQIRKKKKKRQVYVFLEKKILSRSVSLDTWNAVLTTPLKKFCQETSNFLLIPQKSKSFVFSQNFFLEQLRWTRRLPSWFVQIFYWSFRGCEAYGLDTPGVYFCQDSGTFPLKLKKKNLIWIFLK